MVELWGKQFVPYIEHEEILDRVEKVADQINQEHAGEDLLFLSVLNGAFMFTSDLLKYITLPCELQFIRYKSYHGMESTGQVKPLLKIPDNVQGKTVILVEDIVDTGRTISHIVQELKEGQAAKIKVCSLLHKPEALEKDIKIDYVGFEIPNKFVVGYGLDYDELGRNYSKIYQVKEG